MERYKEAALALALAAMLALTGCASSAEGAPGQTEAAPSATGTPGDPATDAPLSARGDVQWPRDKLETGGDGAPTLRVYQTDAKKSERVDVESYVAGVLAGEMKNDWPMEALKAQAILARTFVLKFVEEKQSKYPDADISTDVEEAQAYNAEAVNDRVRAAVRETAGQVLASEGRLPYAWFHSHSGGMTALAREGLGWDKDEPGYTRVVESHEPQRVESDKYTEQLKGAAEWEAAFTLDAFEAACAEAGAKVALDEGTPLEVGERGDSGRAVTLSVNGQAVNASSLRIALGSTKMRSTLLTSLRMEDGKVLMAGKGFGHGVGMSQWGAYGMAEDGRTAEEIVKHYFQNVEIVKIW